MLLQYDQPVLTTTPEFSFSASQTISVDVNPCLVSDLTLDAVANWEPVGDSIIYLYEDDGTYKLLAQKFETIKNPFLHAVKDDLSSGSDCFRYELWKGIKL